MSMKFLFIAWLGLSVLGSLLTDKACAQSDAYPTTWTQSQISTYTAAGQTLKNAIAAAITAFQNGTGPSTFYIDNTQPNFSPTGDYYFPSSDALDISYVNGFNIKVTSGQTVTLWVDGINADGSSGTYKALNLNYCQNMTIDGLTIDYYPMPYLQGRVISLNPSANPAQTPSTITIRLCTGFPLPPSGWATSPPSVKALFYDSTATHMRNVQQDYMTSITGAGDGNSNDYLVTFLNNHPFDTGTIAPTIMPYNQATGYPGDILALPPRVSDCIESAHSTNVTFSNLTLYGSGNMALVESSGGGPNTYSNCKVIPRPGTVRALASNADVLHSGLMQNGPTITGCEFSHAGDDLINIHGYTDLVTQQLDPYDLVVIHQGSVPLPAGTLMDFRDIHSLKSIGTASPVTVTPLTSSPYSPAATYASQFVTTLANTFGVTMLNIFPTPTVYKVTFTSPITIPANTLVNYPGYTGAGAVITNNYLHDTIGNGGLVGSENSTITGNTVQYTGYAGFLVGSTRFWMESRYPSNVTVSNNTLSYCGTSISDSANYNDSPGAISVVSGGMNFALGTGVVNSTVTVQNNTISMPGEAGIFVANVDTGTSITGNTIDHPCQLPIYACGQSLGVGNLEYGIDVVEPYGANISGNTVTNYTDPGCRGDYSPIVRMQESTPTQFYMDDNNTSGVTYSQFSLWKSATTTPGFYKGDYLQDVNTNKGSLSVTYAPAITQPGIYQVSAQWPASPSFSASVPYSITDPFGTTTVPVNEQADGGQMNVIGLHLFTAGTGANLTISNTGTTGNVVADGVQFIQIPLGQSSSVDVGAVGLAGNTTVSNGTFTIQGAGSDIGGSADSCQYSYQGLNGDGTVIAHVVSQTNTNAKAKAGVMIRETLDPGAVEATLAVTPSSGLDFVTRSTTGSVSNVTSVSGITAPYWVKLSRTGNTVTAYSSPDGVTWTAVGTPQTLTMAQVVYIGMAVTSDTTGTLSTGTMSSVAMVPGAAWSSSDIGTGQTVVGASSYSSGSFAMSGSGSAPGGTYDRFRFTNTTLTGDGTISARVAVWQSGTNTAGIIMRNSTDPGAAFVQLAVKPDGQSIRFLYRDGNGNSTNGNARDVLNLPAGPYWLKLVRAANTFTGFYSTDGLTWTTVYSLTPTNTMSTTLDVGLSLASGSDTTASSATFDNVATWTSADIGTGELAGSSSDSNGSLAMSGSGSAPGGTYDRFRFTNTTLTSDGTVSARVAVWQSGTNTAGIIMRNSTDPGAAFVQLAVKPDGQSIRFLYRDGNGNSTNGNARDVLNLPAGPYWLKLVRAGNTFTGSYSTNGTNWTTVYSVTPTNIMSTTLDVGLSLASGSDTTLSSATFDNVTTGPNSP